MRRVDWRLHGTEGFPPALASSAPISARTKQRPAGGAHRQASRIDEALRRVRLDATARLDEAVRGQRYGPLCLVCESDDRLGDREGLAVGERVAAQLLFPGRAVGDQPAAGGAADRGDHVACHGGECLVSLDNDGGDRRGIPVAGARVSAGARGDAGGRRPGDVRGRRPRDVLVAHAADAVAGGARGGAVLRGAATEPAAGDVSAAPRESMGDGGVNGDPARSVGCMRVSRARAAGADAGDAVVGGIDVAPKDDTSAAVWVARDGDLVVVVQHRIWHPHGRWTSR
jgi:hypothetical protein